VPVGQLRSFYGTSTSWAWPSTSTSAHALRLPNAVPSSMNRCGSAPGAWPAWTAPTRHVPLPHPLGRGLSANVRLRCLMLLLILRGTPVLYQGDENSAWANSQWHGRTARPARVRSNPTLRGARRRPHTLMGVPPGRRFTGSDRPWLADGANLPPPRGQQRSTISRLLRPYALRDLIAFRPSPIRVPVRGTHRRGDARGVWRGPEALRWWSSTCPRRGRAPTICSAPFRSPGPEARVNRCRSTSVWGPSRVWGGGGGSSSARLGFEPATNTQHGGKDFWNVSSTSPPSSPRRRSIAGQHARALAREAPQSWCRIERFGRERVTEGIVVGPAAGPIVPSPTYR